MQTAHQRTYHIVPPVKLLAVTVSHLSTAVDLVAEAMAIRHLAARIMAALRPAMATTVTRLVACHQRSHRVTLPPLLRTLFRLLLLHRAVKLSKFMYPMTLLATLSARADKRLTRFAKCLAAISKSWNLQRRKVRALIRTRGYVIANRIIVNQAHSPHRIACDH